MTTRSFESMRMAYKHLIYNTIKYLYPQYIDRDNLCLLIDNIELHCYMKVFADIDTLMRISDESKLNMYKSAIWFSCQKITPIFIQKLNEMVRQEGGSPQTSTSTLLLQPTYEYYEDMKKFADHTMSLSAIEHTMSISIYTCPKCKARDQKIRKKQTASSDEAEKVIATCNQCNQMWIVF